MGITSGETKKQESQWKTSRIQSEGLGFSCPVGEDEVDLMTMFGEAATAEVLRFIENTEVGRPLTKEGNKEDHWDIKQLERRAEEGEETVGDDRE